MKTRVSLLVALFIGLISTRMANAQQCYVDTGNGYRRSVYGGGYNPVAAACQDARWRSNMGLCYGASVSGTVVIRVVYVVPASVCAPICPPRRCFHQRW